MTKLTPQEVFGEQGEQIQGVFGKELQGDDMILLSILYQDIIFIRKSVSIFFSIYDEFVYFISYTVRHLKWGGANFYNACL